MTNNQSTILNLMSKICGVCVGGASLHTISARAKSKGFSPADTKIIVGSLVECGNVTRVVAIDKNGDKTLHYKLHNKD